MNKTMCSEYCFTIINLVGILYFYEICDVHALIPSILYSFYMTHSFNTP
jgi:hypothetical protein